MPDWSSEHQAIPPIPHQSGICEGLLASIDVAESKTSSDGRFGIIVEIMKLVVSVRTAPQLAKLQTDPVFDGGLDGDGPSEGQLEQQLGHTRMRYEI